MTEKQQAIFQEIDRLKKEIQDLRYFAYIDAPRIAAEEANKQIAALVTVIASICKRLSTQLDANNQITALVNVVLQVLDNGIVTIVPEDANNQIMALKDEIARLRQELRYIANAPRKNFEEDPETFRTCAQNLARHALNDAPEIHTTK